MFRFSRQYPFANAGKQNRPRRGAGLELQESGIRLQNRDRASAKTATWTARRPNQRFRPGIAAVFLFRTVRSHHDSRHQSASDELLLSRMRLLFFSSADGLPGGPYFDSPRIRNLLGGFGGIASELPTFGGGNAIRGTRSRARAGDLSNSVFVR